MLKIIAGAVLVTVFAAGHSVEGRATKKKADVVAGPRLEITPEGYDFGLVGQNEKLVKRFEIRNIGTEDLRIKRISTSCGCTAALISEKRVMPGMTAILEVTLESRNYNGALRRSISISSSAPKLHTIKLKAFVEEP